MNTRNVTQPETTEKTAKSVQEVSKKSAGKFSRDFWASRVFRPTYTHQGETREVAEYWVKLQHAGQRKSVALGTPDRQGAARRAAEIYRTVKAQGWDAALTAFAPDRAAPAQAYATVGDVIRAATEAKAADLRARTLRDYGSSTRNLVALTFGIHGPEARFDYVTGGVQAWRQKIDKIRLDRLTTPRVQSALNAKIAAAKGNPALEQSTRTTAATLLRVAKATFAAAEAVAASRKPPSPFENPLEGVKVKVGGPRRYVSQVDVAQLLRDAKAELAEADGEAFKALLLTLGSGLRKSEADSLTWGQVDPERAVIRVGTSTTFATKTSASEGEVFVDPGLVAELERYRPQATGLFVLESPLAPKPDASFGFYRAKRTFARLTAWLRSKGVTGRKPIHDMRREFGSVIAGAAGIYAASRQLRHSGVAVTAAYYADHRNRATLPVGAILGQTTETSVTPAAK
jgi:integrase